MQRNDYIVDRSICVHLIIHLVTNAKLIHLASVSISAKSKEFRFFFFCGRRFLNWFQSIDIEKCSVPTRHGHRPHHLHMHECGLPRELRIGLCMIDDRKEIRIKKSPQALNPKSQIVFHEIASNYSETAEKTLHRVPANSRSHTLSTNTNRLEHSTHVRCAGWASVKNQKIQQQQKKKHFTRLVCDCDSCPDTWCCCGGACKNTRPDVRI